MDTKAGSHASRSVSASWRRFAGPPPASAHGGTRVVWRVAGGFHVAVDALAIRSGDRVGAVDYTVTLQRRGGTPVTDAHVQLTVETPGATIGPLVAHRRARHLRRRDSGVRRSKLGELPPRDRHQLTRHPIGGDRLSTAHAGVHLAVATAARARAALASPAFSTPVHSLVCAAEAGATSRRPGDSRSSEQGWRLRCWRSSRPSTRSASVTCSRRTCFSTSRSATPLPRFWWRACADPSGSSSCRAPWLRALARCGSRAALVEPTAQAASSPSLSGPWSTPAGTSPRRTTPRSRVPRSTISSTPASS